MKVLIQRVKEAAVSVEGREVSRIGKGFLILLGVGKGDTDEDARRLADKMSKLRIFADEAGKTNLALADVGGAVLVISQFTLYADCRKGNRPSFFDAGDPAEAERLYHVFCELCRERISSVGEGVFGAHMEVSLINDGPFTVMLE